ncbi:MAG: T9SS type A sorting domain-containing protein, partial [Flavobacteriaceae bacterium]|nr:T9SS type A sorting domain-containing protein [Flavobacteriaceae bacterium]
GCSASCGDLLTCDVTSVTLIGGPDGASSYSWTGPDGFVSSDQNPSVSLPGEYTLTVTGSNGCDSSCSTIVEQDDTPPGCSATGGHIDCDTPDGTIQLSASTDALSATYSWVASEGGNIVSDADTATPTVNEAGTYTVTITNTDNGCTNTCFATVTEDVTPPSCSATGGHIDCDTPDGTIHLSASTDALSATYSWVASEGGNIVSDADTATPTVNEAGTYTVTITNTDNGCTNTCFVTVSKDIAKPILECSSAPVSCFDVNNGSVSVVASGGNPPYQYNWVNSSNVSVGDGASVSSLGVGTYTVTVIGANGCSNTCEAIITQPSEALRSSTVVTDVTCNGLKDGAIDLTVSGGTPFIDKDGTKYYKYLWSTGAKTEDISGLSAGNYTVKIRDKNDCVIDDGARVGEPITLICNDIVTGFNEIPFCGDNISNTLQASATGGSGNYSYSWSVDAVALGNGWSINGSDTQQIVSFIPGAGQATFTALITDENDCEVSCSVLIEPCPMDEIFCSYTQGFYGNPGGLACIPEEQQVNAKYIMLGALNASGGQFDFGDVNTGKYFSLYLADIQNDNIFKMLPGGGPSNALKGYSTYDLSDTWGNVPLVNNGPRRGKIKNNLFSQTMTLYFNLYADQLLYTYELDSAFYTAATVSCGSEKYIVDTIEMFQISEQIIAYLEATNTNTVQGLFDLANRALGGHDIGNLSYSSITGAVDAINRGFDECRILLSESVYDSVVSSLVDNKPIFTIYPVPFVDNVKIKYEIDNGLTAKIQVFDISGRLVKTVIDKDVYYHKVTTLELNHKIFANQMYFVRITSGDKSTMKKIISVR